MGNGLDLSAVQELSSSSFAERVQQLTREEAQALLIAFHQQVQHQEHHTKKLLAKIADIMDALA